MAELFVVKQLSNSLHTVCTTARIQAPTSLRISTRHVAPCNSQTTYQGKLTYLPVRGRSPPLFAGNKENVKRSGYEHVLRIVHHCQSSSVFLLGVCVDISRLK